MQKLVIQKHTVGPAYGLTTLATQSFDVHCIQMNTLKGPQQLDEKKKGKGKKGSGDNNKKTDKNVEGAKDEKRKVKLPCKLCDEDHLTHQCPRMEESQGGTSCAPPSDGYQGEVNTISHSNLKDIYFSTRYQNYDSPKLNEKDKKASEDHAPLHIEKPKKETMSHIHKCVYKWTTHNPNERVTPNYSIVEDLAQTPYAILTLEVLQSLPS
jgi:hypothetical protein